MEMLRKLLESCTAEDAKTIIYCLAMRHPEATIGIPQAGPRQIEILKAIEEGYTTSPALQKKLGLTGNNVCTRLQGMEKAGYVVIDRTYQKNSTYRRVTVDEILAGLTDE